MSSSLKTIADFRALVVDEPEISRRVESSFTAINLSEAENEEEATKALGLSDLILFHSMS